MRKMCDIQCVYNGYVAHFEGYHDNKDTVRPFVLYLKSYTYDEMQGYKTHKNKIARYGDYKTLLRDIADRF